jgi:hypothetical protein
VTVAYAGNLGPAEAYELLEQDPDAVLVDVRTRAEWAYVGLPDLTGLGKDVVRVEWTRYPDGARNAAFLDELAAAGVDLDAVTTRLLDEGVAAFAASMRDLLAGPAPTPAET